MCMADRRHQDLYTCTCALHIVLYNAHWSPDLYTVSELPYHKLWSNARSLQTSPFFPNAVVIFGAVYLWYLLESLRLTLVKINTPFQEWQTKNVIFYYSLLKYCCTHKYRKMWQETQGHKTYWDGGEIFVCVSMIGVHSSWIRVHDEISLCWRWM